MRDAVLAAFRDRFGRRPAVVVRAPGRVAFLGAHVDTAEGWALPAAIDRAVWLAAGPGETGRLRLAALDLDAAGEVPLAPLPPPVAARNGAGTSWSDVPAAVAWALGQAGHDAVPLDVVYGGDLPIGAGVSSSAAVEVAFLLAWDRLGGLGLARPAMARLGRAAENGYLGVRSGPMDQAASLLGEDSAALLLDCRSLDATLVPFPSGTAVLVADSGVRRRLSATGFGDRRAEVEEATAVLARAVPGLRTLRDLDPDVFERHAGDLAPVLARRARHVVLECARVRAGADDLARGDLAAFGRRVVDSHAGSRDLFEVSTPELDFLAATAAATPGCWGARLSGGGFGGAVVALVDAEAAAEVAAALRREFAAVFGREVPVFETRIGPGAEVWDAASGGGP